MNSDTALEHITNLMQEWIVNINNPENIINELKEMAKRMSKL